MHVDAMSLAIKAEFDPPMNQAFASHSLADPSFIQQIHRALFQDARTNAILDMLASLDLYDDRLNARKMQELAQDKSGWSGSDDRNLGTMAFAHPRLSLSAHLRKYDNVSISNAAARTRARATSMVNLS